MLDLCDRVVLLDGRVAAVGTHRELLRESTAYRDVVVRTAELDSELAPPIPVEPRTGLEPEINVHVNVEPAR
jgi:ABC-type multidrug transport system ATPase subunit